MEYLTSLENTKHAIENGLIDNRGEKHYKVKLIENQVKMIRLLYIIFKYRQMKLAEIYDVSQTTIKNIVNYCNWKHI